MSDFDKEAERERLREKYERDEQKRAVTERMSELLLKGATMTNAHCEVCGDPIFRYDGQEFCATCERAVERPGQDEGDEQTDDSADEAAGEAAANGDAEEIEVATPSEETRVQFGGEATAPSAGTPEEPAGSGETAAPESEKAQVPQPPRGDVAAEPGNLADARAALERTVTSLARRAEASDDLDRQRDLLAAAREAAEALSAVRDAGR